MGPVRLQYVISFSSQDEKYPVENLLNKTGQPTGRGWLSSSSDRSGLLEAEFQLEKAAYIHYIDIGNCGSSSIEIAVGRSSWPRSRKYISLLPAVTMMTYSESKNCVNRISVRMFTSDDLNSEAVKMKWDRVRVVCSQPYRKDVPFGISFLRLGNKETEPDPMPGPSINPLKESIKKNFSDVISSNGSLMKGFSTFNTLNRNILNKLPASTSFSRGHNLVDAALNAKSHVIQQHLVNTETEIDHSANMDFDSSSLEMDILLFLTSKENRNYADTVDECLQEYEEVNGVDLTFPQTRIFLEVFQSVFQSDQNSAEPIPIQHSGLAPNNFYSSQQTKRKLIEVKDVTHDESEDHLSFDLNFERKKCNGHPQGKSLQNGKHCHEDDDDLPIVELSCRVKKKKLIPSVEKDSSELPLITIEDETDNSPQGHIVSEHSSDDLIQFDGSKPGPSREVVYVECPICGDPFHVQEIERHAATCEKYASEESEEEENDSNKASSSSNVVPVNCHAEKYLECPVCGNMFQKTALPSHANVCIENCLA